MQAYSYVRWSSAKQTKGDSLRRQTELAAEYAAEHNLTLDNSTYQDHGISAYKGKNVVEGKLGTFLKAVDDGLVKTPCYLLVEALDRITRLELMSAMRLFISIIERGVTIVTLIDNQKYSAESINAPGGEMLMFGAMYSLVMANRVNAERAGRVKKAWDKKRELQKSGVIASRKCPAWLSIKPGVTAPTVSDWIVDKPKRETIQFIFKQCLKGKGAHVITRTLNEDTLPNGTLRRPPFGRATRWGVSSVQKILKYPAVYGEFNQVNGGEVIPNYYPVIISKKDFDAAQSSIQGRNGSGGWNQGITNLFSHISKCAYCGSGLRIQGNTARKVLRLYLYCRNALVRKCNARAIHYQPLESDVIVYIAQFMKKDLKIHRLEETNSSRHRELEQEAKAKQAELEKWASALLHAPNVAVIAERMKQAQDELDAIMAERAKLSRTPISQKDIDDTIELLSKLHTDRSDPDFDISTQKDLRLSVLTALRRQIKRIDIAPHLQNHKTHWKDFAGFADLKKRPPKPTEALHLVKVIFVDGTVGITDVLFQ